MTRFNAKIIPSSTRDAIVGWLGPALKIKLKAPPEQGKANAALIRFLAVQLGVKKESIQIVKGHTAPFKFIEIKDMDHTEFLNSIERILAHAPS